MSENEVSKNPVEHRSVGAKGSNKANANRSNTATARATPVNERPQHKETISSIELAKGTGRINFLHYPMRYLISY